MACCSLAAPSWAAETTGLAASHAVNAANIAAAKPDIRVENNVVYRTVDAQDVKMDVARPDGSGPFPLVVCVHGGAWRGGSKSNYASQIKELAQHGYVAVAIDYRLAPQSKFPAQIEDVKCALQFMCDHAKDYAVDPEHVALVGDSAGGHLSLLAGLSDEKDFAPEAKPNAQHAHIKAIVNYYGPSDFTVWKSVNPLALMIMRDFLGTVDPKSAVIAKASPVTYIDAKDPAVLTFHGGLDPIVPLEQSEHLHEALKKAGVEEHLTLVPTGSHGWGGADRERTNRETLEFLDKKLK